MVGTCGMVRVVCAPQIWYTHKVENMLHLFAFVFHGAMHLVLVICYSRGLDLKLTKHIVERIALSSSFELWFSCNAHVPII